MKPDPGLILGVDASAARTNVALLQNNQVLAETGWPSDRNTADRVLQAIRILLAQQASTWEHIALYAAGKGPGNYTGLRISMSLVQALALPGRQTVRGVSSALAYLVDGLQQHPEAPAVAVLGDARRKHLWLYTLERGCEPARASEQILTREALTLHPFTTGTLVLSPDFERLAPTVTLPADCHWYPTAVAPRAATIASLACSLPPSMTQTDIRYVHPPVFVPPAFPAAD